MGGRTLFWGGGTITGPGVINLGRGGGGGLHLGRGGHCLRSPDATVLCFEPLMCADAQIGFFHNETDVPVLCFEPLMCADAQIGFFHNETDVPESSGVVMLTLGVLAGELEEMVNISFSTDSSSAIGRCFIVAGHTL